MYINSLFLLFSFPIFVVFLLLSGMPHLKYGIHRSTSRIPFQLEMQKIECSQKNEISRCFPISRSKQNSREKTFIRNQSQNLRYALRMYSFGNAKSLKLTSLFCTFFCRSICSLNQRQMVETNHRTMPTHRILHNNELHDRDKINAINIEMIEM